MYSFVKQPSNLTFEWPSQANSSLGTITKQLQWILWHPRGPNDSF